MKRTMADFVVFGKVVSTGLLIAGYMLLGAIVSRKLVERGWPDWVAVGGPTVMAVFGLTQGWAMMRHTLKKK